MSNRRLQQIVDAQAQAKFISENELFFPEFENLQALETKLFGGAFERFNLPAPPDQTPTEVEKEKVERLAQIIVLYLLRSVHESFADILLLAANGRGLGARMLLRSMYEHLVTAAYISENPSEAKTFDDNADFQKGKIWNRAVKVVPEIRDLLTPDEQKRIEDAFQAVKDRQKQELCKTCHQPRNEDAWTLVNTDAMARKVDRATGSGLEKLYTPCFLVPTNLLHPTAFGLQCRSGNVDSGEAFRSDTSHEAQDSLMRGHGLILRSLKLLNGYFGLNFGESLSERWAAFPVIWKGVSPDA